MARTLVTRLLLGITYLVGAVVVIYLAGANLILNTGVLDGVINRKPEKTLVEWESGWTILPGFIHVEGLRVRGQSKTQQWQFRLGEADVRLHLLALPDKTVRSTRVTGTDFHFRQRPRLTEATAISVDISHFPEIEGLSNPPDPDPEDIYPSKKKEKRGWHIDVSNVHLGGSIELAVGDFEMTGTGTVDGGVDYQLPETLLVPRAVFDLDGGEIAIRGTTFVNDLRIQTDAVLGPFAPRQTRGLEIFDALLGRFTLENGTIPDVRVLNGLIPGGETFELAEGTASFSWSFDKPSVEEGSHGDIEISAPGTRMLMRGRSVFGDLGLTSKLQSGSIAEGRFAVGDATLTLENLDLRGLGSDENQRASPAPPDELWWGRFTIHRGQLEVGNPSDLDVELEFEMKNTEPLLHLFLTKQAEDDSAKLPGWTKLLPDIRNIGGRGMLAVDGERALLNGVVIDGDELDVTAWLESRNQVTNGKLYLRYKKLELGLAIEDGKKDLKILRPRRWALAQPELDRSVIEGAGGS